MSALSHGRHFLRTYADADAGSGGRSGVDAGGKEGAAQQVVGERFGRAVLPRAAGESNGVASIQVKPASERAKPEASARKRQARRASTSRSFYPTMHHLIDPTKIYKSARRGHGSG